MPADVCVLIGPAQSGKTARLLAEYRASLRRVPPGGALWLSPTQRAVSEVRDRLLSDDFPACLAPGVQTFAQFVADVLRGAPRPVRTLDELGRCELVSRLCDERTAQGAWRYYGPIADKPGFRALLVAFLRETKRLEIWPEQFAAACAREGRHPKDEDLAALYAAYQDRLLAHDLYDAEGRFWSARTLLQQARTRFAAVVVDGFTDFTRTELEMLATLAERGQTFWLSLPGEADDRRPDLFAKSRHTLAQLRGQLPALRVEYLSPRATGWPAAEHLQRELFASPRQTRPAPCTAGLEIHVAASDVNELEWIAREVKRLLVEGDASGGGPVHPEQIAVVFRSLRGVAPLVRETFAATGLPLALEEGRPLHDSGLLTALAAVLRLVEEDWPFRQLLALVTSTYFHPGWPEFSPFARTAAQRLIGELQIPHGAPALLERAQRHARQLHERVGEGDEEATARHAAREADEAVRLLQRLQQTLARVPRQATLAEWSFKLEQLVGGLGFLQAAAVGSEPLAQAAARVDLAAWNRLQEALAAAGRLWPVVAGDRRLTLSELLELLATILAEEQIPEPRSDVGRVRVLSAISARNLRFDYLFLAGLTEKSFPPPQREDRAYSEVERARLRAAGLPLPVLADRARDEMLLFYELLTRAGRRLWLSYAGLDEKAQPMLCSPYVTEVERACGATAIGRSVDEDLSPLPREPTPADARSARLLAVAAALSGDASLLAALPALTGPDVARQLCQALHVAHERSARERFGPYEGLLLSAAARAALAERYPPEQIWSPSKLEAYATCPFRYFATHLLRLREPAELTLASRHAERGSLLHAALHAVYRRWTAAHPAGRRPTESPDEFRTELARIVEELRGQPGPGDAVQAALHAVDLQLIERYLADHLSQHAQYDEQVLGLAPQLAPAHLEVSFGSDLTAPATDAALSTPEPLVIRCGSLEIRLAGRIDRLDVGVVQGQTVFSVVDYKSGSSTRLTSKNAAPLRLQLPLYALAAEEVLLREQRAVGLSAGYWFVRQEGYHPTEKLAQSGPQGITASDDWQQRREWLRTTLAGLVHSIHEGQFPVHSRDDDCTGSCPLKTVCRIGQIRSLEKTWAPLPPPA